jgi:DnaJ-class molecular chaperone
VSGDVLCTICHGSGIDPDLDIECPRCDGEGWSYSPGKAAVMALVRQSAERQRDAGLDAEGQEGL